MKTLEREVQLEHTRAMNRILFDMTVSSQPETFPFVTLPEPEVTPVPCRGDTTYTYVLCHSIIVSIHCQVKKSLREIVCGEFTIIPRQLFPWHA